MPAERKRMDRNVKRRWIRALLSGKFKQGQSSLRKVNDNYCCLGVLLCVVDDKGWTLRKHKGWYEQDEWHHKRQQKQDDYLSLSLIKDLNINDDDQRALANMNDDGKTFKQIANWIEKNL